jgi:hypothetical protein
MAHRLLTGTPPNGGTRPEAAARQLKDHCIRATANSCSGENAVIEPSDWYWLHKRHSDCSVPRFRILKFNGRRHTIYQWLETQIGNLTALIRGPRVVTENARLASL